MYRAEFEIMQVSLPRGTITEKFRIVSGGGRVHTREDRAKRMARENETMRHFSAHSQKPFVVVTILKASGDYAESDGMIVVIYPTDETGTPCGRANAKGCIIPA